MTVTTLRVWATHPAAGDALNASVAVALLTAYAGIVILIGAWAVPAAAAILGACVQLALPSVRPVVARAESPAARRRGSRQTRGDGAAPGRERVRRHTLHSPPAVDAGTPSPMGVRHGAAAPQRAGGGPTPTPAPVEAGRATTHTTATAQ